MIEFLSVLIAILLGVTLLLVGAIFVVVRKGLNEIIKGMNSLDERLCKLEQVGAKNDA